MSDLPEVDAIAEVALIDRAIAGDRDSLAVLLKRYGPLLQARLRGEIGTRWQSLLDVEDVIQVTFLECFLKIGKFQNRGPGSFEAWITRICRHNLLDAVRCLKRVREFPQEKRITFQNEMDSSVALLELVGVTSATPSRHATTQETHLRVRQAVAQLPRDYSQVLTLYDLELLSIDDVAGMMGRTTGAVYMLRARALDYLREILGSESRV